MTRDEFIETWSYRQPRESFAADLDALLKAERERCAGVAEKMAAEYADAYKKDDTSLLERMAACEEVADEIRSLA